MTLDDFMRAAAGRSFQLGEWDCGLFCADWVKAQCGADPAAEWRGRYSTFSGLMRILRQRGGLIGHFDLCLAGVGIFRTDEPRRGDVVVVATPEPTGIEGAIVRGSSVLMAGRNGGIIVRARRVAPILAAWRVDPCWQPTS